MARLLPYCRPHNFEHQFARLRIVTCSWYRSVTAHLMSLIALHLEQFHYFLGRVEDAIASSDITKAPFVKQ